MTAKRTEKHSPAPKDSAILCLKNAHKGEADKGKLIESLNFSGYLV